ncbi:DUF4352 domain-containing protein [Candidatus Riflebacteria bacterium]
MVCPFCQGEIPDGAQKCQLCGEWIKKPKSCLEQGCGCLLVIFLLSFLARECEDPAKREERRERRAASRAPTQKVYSQNEQVNVGYTSYKIWRVWRASSLSGLGELKPNISFLVIDITVRNNDKKERTVPPFHLIDENGAQYGVSNETTFVEESFGVLTSLNPGVSKKGWVIFDVPRKKYKLKLSGGYWSGADAFIKLDTN